MDGVAQEAAALCACKAALSLLFLPSLAACNSLVSFCCCFLLLFTDLLIAGFLSFLCVFEPWLSQLDAPTAAAVAGDVIALRFLLFLSHLYGAVLILCPPMIAAEALTRLSRSTVAPRQRWMDCDCLFREEKEKDGEMEEEKEEEEEEEGVRLSHAVSYICSLSLWLTVALDIRWRPRPELLRTSVCLQTSCSSLVECLPTLHRVAATTLNPSLAAASALLVLLFLLVRAGSRGPRPTPAAARRGPGKTESSCGVHADFVLVSPEHHSTAGGEEPPLTLTRGVGHVWPRRGFPWPEVDVTTGVMAVLLVFALPPVLSVNILLIRTVETLVELSVKSLLAWPRKRIGATPACKDQTGEAHRGRRLDAV